MQTHARDTSEVELLARRIVREVAEPFIIDGLELEIGTSIGYALSSEYGVDLDDLMKRADEALYVAKRQGGGIVAYSSSTERAGQAPSLFAQALFTPARERC